ncbi:TIR domain-containing protein [Saccharothrix sp. Mg75]|uniref:TIR domain-containing protein n=1 Tax=Saccharothrix sp. Mg75 TaxID=3445357 RepID=UPI003EEF261B
MTADNPYYSRSLFVGRAAQLAEVTQLLRQGRSALLIGGRRAGKTTFARHVTEDVVGRAVVRTDVAGWDLTSEEAALGALLSAVRGAQETAHARASRHEVALALDAIRPVALVVDEADRVLLAQWGPGFFSFLRWLDDTHLRDDIAILLAGGPVLAVFRDPDDRGSPPLNTAVPRFLDPLDRAAVAELAVHVDGVDLDALVEQCGGHPWLTTHLLAALHGGRPFDDALDDVFDLVSGTFPVWERQLGDDGRSLLRLLPADGLTKADLRAGRWARFREAARSGRSIGVLRVEAGRLRHGPRLFGDWFLRRSPEEVSFDLAISYASEDEALARQLNAHLRDDFRVFYAPDQGPQLWGTDLNRVLPNTYGVASRYVLVLCTPVYVAKHWTRIEYDAVATRAPERILLVGLGELPADLPDGLVYRGGSPGELVGLVSAIRDKLKG